jgi:hypothetical protein
VSIRVSKSPYLRFESVRPKDAQATLAQTVEATVLREARLVAPLAEVTTERLCGSRLARPGVEEGGVIRLGHRIDSSLQVIGHRERDIDAVFVVYEFKPAIAHLLRA